MDIVRKENGCKVNTSVPVLRVSGWVHRPLWLLRWGTRFGWCLSRRRWGRIARRGRSCTSIRILCLPAIPVS